MGASGHEMAGDAVYGLFPIAIGILVYGSLAGCITPFQIAFYVVRDETEVQWIHFA
jgi:hypothetical protein